MESLNISCPAVSVTVPVYNTSKYLRKCLDSLQSQTLKNIEFIIVDDGSTDDSGVICDEYAKSNPKFKVIHQKNGGLASARQTGLNHARGEYVIVCDSDDWVEPDMYERLYNEAKKSRADIILCGYYAEYETNKSIPIQNILKESGGLIDNEDFLRRGAGASWIKLIKRNLFEKAHASYAAGINMGEDALILYKLLRVNPKCVQINGCYYHYRRLFGEDTYTNSGKMSNIHQSNFKYEWFKKVYSDNRYDDIKRQLAIAIAFSCLRTKDLDRTFFSNFLKKEVPYKILFIDRISLKKIIVLMSKVFPLSFTRIFLRYFYKFFYK